MAGHRDHMRRRKLVQDQRGATAIEYGLIAALISLAALIAFRMLGLSLEGVFNTINAAFLGALGG